MQLGRWSGQCAVPNCELNIVEVARLIEPLMVKIQRVTTALEGLT